MKFRPFNSDRKLVAGLLAATAIALTVSLLFRHRPRNSSSKTASQLLDDLRHTVGSFFRETQMPSTPKKLLKRTEKGVDPSRQAVS